MGSAAKAFLGGLLHMTRVKQALITPRTNKIRAASCSPCSRIIKEESILLYLLEQSETVDLSRVKIAGEKWEKLFPTANEMLSMEAKEIRKTKKGRTT